MRPFLVRSTLGLVLVAGVACSDSSSPAPPLNETGLTADLSAAVATANTQATTSLGNLGPRISTAISSAGGALGIAELPSYYLKDPMGLRRTPEQWSRIAENSTTPSVIPAAALGKTFVYDTGLLRYVASDLPGAPANGVRFVLYAVDTLTDQVIVPLVQTGYADITRTVLAGVATARVEVFAAGETATKALDYAASVTGGAMPTALVQGFARNGVDSLAFKLVSTVSLVNGTIGVNWRSEVPTRGFVTHVAETLKLSETALKVAFEGILKSNSGWVSMTGTVDAGTGGEITVKVNGDKFATIVLAGGLESEPVVTGPTGQPLTPEQEAMLRDIFEWFARAFEFFDSLLAPVDGLIDAAF